MSAQVLLGREASGYQVDEGEIQWRGREIGTGNDFGGQSDFSMTEGPCGLVHSHQFYAGTTFQALVPLLRNNICTIYASFHHTTNIMVLLTLTPTARAAVDDYVKLRLPSGEAADEELDERITLLSKTAVGSPVEHQDIVDISRHLLEKHRQAGDIAREWRLDSLLRGATVYQPAPPPKPEPVCEHPSNSCLLYTLTLFQLNRPQSSRR